MLPSSLSISRSESKSKQKLAQKLGCGFSQSKIDGNRKYKNIWRLFTKCILEHNIPQLRFQRVIWVPLACLHSWNCPTSRVVSINALLCMHILEIIFPSGTIFLRFKLLICRRFITHRENQIAILTNIEQLRQTL